MSVRNSNKGYQALEALKESPELRELTELLKQFNISPEGLEPSYDCYLPISYKLICEIIKNLTDNASPMNAEVRILINKEQLDFGLTMGPGISSEAVEIRNGIFKMTNEPGSPFEKISNLKNYVVIFGKSFLEPEDYEKSWEFRENKIKQKWKEFTETDLPKIISAIKNQIWFKSPM
jgi:hypothetical protein